MTEASVFPSILWFSHTNISSKSSRSGNTLFRTPAIGRAFSVDGAVPDKASDNVTVQRFRKDCLRELKKIKLAWPELNYATAKGVLIPLSLDPVHRAVI